MASKKAVWAFPTESFEQERAARKKARQKAYSRWMGIVKGGPGSGNFGHCGGEGGPGNPGGSRPAGDCGVQLEVPEYAESSKDLRKLRPDEEWSDATGRRRNVTVFHFSKEDRSETGLKREYAGTAAAGEERQSMEYEGGKLKPESAVIHAYLFGAKREKIVPGKVMHRIETVMNVIDVGSDEYQEILQKARELAKDTGRPALAHAREMVVDRGYDALVSQRHGMMQILRDVEPEEIRVVNPKNDLPYEIKPMQEIKEQAIRILDNRIKTALSRGPSEDGLSLRIAAESMRYNGLISEEDQKRIAGGWQDDDLKKVEDVHKIRDELIAAIKPDADEKEKAAAISYLKYTLLAGKTLEQVQDEQLEQMENVLSDSRPMIRMPLKVTDQFFKDGRFKSQFETNTSGGALNQGYREMTENKNIGIPKDLDPKDRPIYGYAGDEVGSFGGSQLDHYGDVAFVLKKDVLSRTTVTFGDSMDNALAVSDYNSPERYSLNPYVGGEAITRESVGYVELQYHGGVSLNDVEKIIVSERRMKLIAEAVAVKGEPVPKFFENAKANGLKIEIAGMKSVVPFEELMSSKESVAWLLVGSKAAFPADAAEVFISALKGKW